MTKKTIYILIISLLVIGAWIAFEIYHQSQETTLPEIVQQQIEPIKAELPTGFFAELEGRIGNRVGDRLGY